MSHDIIISLRQCKDWKHISWKATGKKSKILAYAYLIQIFLSISWCLLDVRWHNAATLSTSAGCIGSPYSESQNRHILASITTQHIEKMNTAYKNRDHKTDRRSNITGNKYLSEMCECDLQNAKHSIHFIETRCSLWLLYFVNI